jgi:phage tail tape-measure protein
MTGMFVGSCAGGYAATLFGADAISFAVVLGSTAGGILGIWLAYKLAG